MVAMAALARPPPPWHWDLPAGVAPPSVPEDNSMSAAKVELGRWLFYDADLSIDGTTSCGTCHEQHRAFTEGNRTHGGVGGARGRRNVMPLANVGYFSPLTWADSTQNTLEKQSLVPLMGSHPVEMGMRGQDAEMVRRLAADPCYRRMFAGAFPGHPIDTGTVTKALATFERTLLSFNSPYDHFLRGNSGAISEQAKLGADLFKRGCASCHVGPNFTDEKYHNIGLPFGGSTDVADHGLGEITGSPKDDGTFRTPSLRNVALTGPYMHDGSISDLSAAIRGHADLVFDGRALGDLDLSYIVAFLQSLSDPSFVTKADYSLPKSFCGRVQ
jgi:cytochrome c peroxidase